MNHSDLIESYVQGELSREDVRKFEMELRTNPDLASQVEAHRNAVALIKSYGHDKKKQHLNNLLDKRNGRNRLIRWILIALVSTGIIAAYLVYNSQKEEVLHPDVIFATYFEDYTMQGVQRGSTAEVLANIQNEYVKGNYEKVLNILEGVDVIDANLSMVKGVSLMNLNEFELAVASFDQAMGLNNSLYSYTILYYQGLCYLKLGEMEKSKQLFTKISLSDSSFSDEAKAILNKI